MSDDDKSTVRLIAETILALTQCIVMGALVAIAILLAWQL